MNTEQHKAVVDALQAMVTHGELLNYAFYVDGTSKALRPVMAEQKALLDQSRKALKAVSVDNAYRRARRVL